MKKISSHMSPLRRVRQESGQSLQEVARAIRYDAGNLSRIERRQQAASADIAAKLAAHFGGRISELEILYPDRYMSVDSPSGDAGCPPAAV